MPGRQLEKQIDKALGDFERWAARQPAWKAGKLKSASGRAVSPHGPAILSETDAVLQFARFLNKQGVPWKDIHLQVSPGQWLVDKSIAGNAPPKIDLAIVDRDRLGKRAKPLQRHKKEDFLFDAVLEFTLVGPNRKRAQANAIARDTQRVRRYLDDLWARRGYVIVLEETDHAWERPQAKPVDALSVHYLRAY